MPIRKRTPAVLTEEKGKQRHRLLKHGTVFNMIWSYIDLNPDCTAEDITTATGAQHQRISTLVDEGLVVVSGRKGRHRTFRTVKENMTGHGRDTLDVEIAVFRNKYGEYSISAKLIGELPGAVEGDPRQVHTRSFKVLVPRPTESPHTRQVFDVQTSAPEKTSEIRSRKPAVIDGNFSIVDDSDASD